jgi:T5SS/PEP-CTERM-associated repeat protein
MMIETLTAKPEPIAAEAKLAKDLPLIPVTRKWNTSGDGRFNDPSNWNPPGIPTADDTVNFEIGGSPTFTVTFPGNLLGELPATYTTNKLRVRGNGITFSGSVEVNRDDATYTVASTDMSEAGRGIIIGVDAGNTAVLDVSPASPSGLGLAKFNCAAATLGEAAGSTGTMNINFGAFNVTGSDFTATQLIVGNHGAGTLNISNGAKLNVPGFNSRVVLGNNAGSVGSITVSGAGTTWTNLNQLWVGGSGSGTLIIQRGGRLRCTSSAGSSNVIGTFAGASGTATINGTGSTWTCSNELIVGNGGNGTLTIVNGGSFVNNVSGFSRVAIGTSGRGSATVTGPGSTLNTVGAVDVGSTGVGVLAVLNGGRVISGRSLIRGLNTGSGQVRIAGAGSTWTVTNGPLTIGLPEPGFSTGPTKLAIDPGGTVTVANNIDLDTNGLLQLHGGTLTVNEIGLAGGLFKGQFDWTSGTLHVNLFRKALTNTAGKLAPGLVNGGAIIDGNYTQLAGAELEIVVGGPMLGTQYVFLGLEGGATLDGSLRLTLINGFVPTAAQKFTVLASFGITGTFSNVADGQRLTTTNGVGSFVVHYEPADSEGRTHITLTDFAL